MGIPPARRHYAGNALGVQGGSFLRRYGAFEPARARSYLCPPLRTCNVINPPIRSEHPPFGPHGLGLNCLGWWLPRGILRLRVAPGWRVPSLKNVRRGGNHRSGLRESIFTDAPVRSAKGPQLEGRNAPASRSRRAPCWSRTWSPSSGPSTGAGLDQKAGLREPVRWRRLALAASTAPGSARHGEHAVASALEVSVRCPRSDGGIECLLDVHHR